MAIFCALCGKNPTLVGRAHLCIPRADALPNTIDTIDTIADDAAVAPTAISGSVTHDATHYVTHRDRTKAAARQAKYRAKHPELYRQRHRDYMRRRRAAARTS
jgi:hypothetical protein